MNKNVSAESRMAVENPVCKPKRSLDHATSQGPIMPPSPEKVNSTPRMVLMFSCSESETEAVRVGKMIEKKKPVSGMKMLKGVNTPIDMLNMASRDAMSVERRYPSRLTMKLPRSRPSMSKPKKSARWLLLAAASMLRTC